MTYAESDAAKRVSVKRDWHRSVLYPRLADGNECFRREMFGRVRRRLTKFAQ